MRPNTSSKQPLRRTYLVLLIFLGLVAALGGGARSDIFSLAILRPASVVVLGYAIWKVDRQQINQHRAILYIVFSAVTLTALHLLPLPPQIWQSLPGRGILAEIQASTGSGPTWQPLSMAPAGTINALFSLTVPLATLLLCIQLTKRELTSLSAAIVIFTLISGLLAVVQTIGSPEGPAYLYKVTNHGAAVGLFANRNHQAVLLAITLPCLALTTHMFRRSHERRRFSDSVAMAIALLLIPLVLVTGSRAGLAIALIMGLLALPLISRHPIAKDRRAKRKFDPLILVGAIFASILVLLFILLHKAAAFERLTGKDVGDDLRISIWQPTVDLIVRYFPLGSGVGTFSEVYQISEQDRLLDLFYINHAHNDYLEVAMTSGLPGLVILGAAVVWYVTRARRLVSAKGSDLGKVALGRAGAAILLAFAASSAFDYPLRVPSMSALFCIALVWLSFGSAEVFGLESANAVADPEQSV